MLQSLIIAVIFGAAAIFWVGNDLVIAGIYFVAAITFGYFAVEEHKEDRPPAAPTAGQE